MIMNRKFISGHTTVWGVMTGHVMRVMDATAPHTASPIKIVQRKRVGFEGTR